MARAVVLSVLAVRTAREPWPPAAKPRLSARALAAAKAAGILVAAAVLAATRLYPTLAGPVSDAASGFAVRFPRGWHINQWSLVGVEACELRGEARRPGPRMPPGPTAGCRIALERLTRDDFERVCRLLAGFEPSGDWRIDKTRTLAEIARYLGMHGPGADVERTRMGGRPALMLTAPRYDGWGSVVLACDSAEVAFLHLYVRTPDEMRRLRPTWQAMVRAVRLRGSAVSSGAERIPPQSDY